LEWANGKLQGTFWVTSDEFDTAREGYYPGFTVLGMQNLTLRGDSIFFLLDSHKRKFFSGPIDIAVTSDEEAAKQGYHDWLQESSFFADSVNYKGVIADSILYLDETKHRWSRKFFRKSEKDIKHMERKMDAKLELENRHNFWYPNSNRE